MIKVLEDLNDNRVKSINKNISTVICRLKTIQENLQFTAKKYDLETLYDILSQMYDALGDFNISVYDNDNV